MEDLFPEFAPMSNSQEQLLQRKRFDPDPFPEISSRYQHHYDDAAAHLIPTNIFMVDIQGVLHAPGTQIVDHLPNCSLNTVDDETLDLMDFGNDSNLGFPEYLHCVQTLSQMDFDYDYDQQVRVSQPQNSHLGEPPHKKMKSLEMNAVNDEQMNVDDDDDDDDICTENKYLVFDVLRVLANARAVEEEKKNKKRTLLEAAKSIGITYTRPRHWPKNWKSQFFRFNDEV